MARIYWRAVRFCSVCDNPCLSVYYLDRYFNKEIASLSSDLPVRLYIEYQVNMFGQILIICQNYAIISIQNETTITTNEFHLSELLTAENIRVYSL